MQPRDAGGDNTQTTSREDKVRTIVDDVMEKLPELFNMRELMAKVEERTPYVIVCFQVLVPSLPYGELLILSGMRADEHDGGGDATKPQRARSRAERRAHHHLGHGSVVRFALL